VKVLFLDIDGVLNSSQHFKRTTELRNKTSKLGLDYQDSEWLTNIDPICTNYLKQLMRMIPDLNIVISSTWRKSHPIGLFKKNLSEMLSISPDRILDKTPSLHGDGQVRGDEIQDWLNNHPEVTKFAILDDDSDMAHLKDKLFKTTWEHGLQMEHIQNIARYLNG
jgi:hypothetical protein